MISSISWSGRSLALEPGNLDDVFPVSALQKMLPRFESSININTRALLFQGLLNFLERTIEEEVIEFPLDLSPYDFVATNCHTADEEVRSETEWVLSSNHSSQISVETTFSYLTFTFIIIPNLTCS